MTFLLKKSAPKSYFLARNTSGHKTLYRKTSRSLRRRLERTPVSERLESHPPWFWGSGHLLRLSDSQVSGLSVPGSERCLQTCMSSGGPVEAVCACACAVGIRPSVTSEQVLIFLPPVAAGVVPSSQRLSPTRGPSTRTNVCHCGCTDRVAGQTLMGLLSLTWLLLPSFLSRFCT